VYAFDRILRRKFWDIVTNKLYREHMIQTIKNLYEGTAISMDKGANKSSKTEMTDQGLRQGCLCYPYTATTEWQMELRSPFSLGTIILDTLLFADDQVIFAKSEDELQMATLQINNVFATYSLDISHDKRKI
jgi:hypothetical protein